MEKKLTLVASRRSNDGEKAKDLRKKGFLPAVLYGNKIENRPLVIKQNEFEKIYSQAGENTLVELKLEGEAPVKVLIYDVQKSAVRSEPEHVDFYQVDMKKKVRTEIPLKYSGESKAVKELGGVFIKNMDSVEIECLPDDLVHEIILDITPLQNLDDFLKVKDIKFPNGITPVVEPETIVASVIEPKVEEEPEAPVSVEDVEVVGKGKEEAAPGEEGGEGTEKEKEAKK